MADSDATSSASTQNELKKRARRRLVGAAALALTAAIVLPMVMDHEPRPPAQEIQIRIPAQDGGTFTARSTEAPPSPNEPLSAAGKGDGGRSSGSASVGKPAEAVTTKPAEAPAVSAAVKTGGAEDGQTNAKPVEKPARMAEPPSPRPERPSAANAEEARAAALLAGGAGGGGEWVIQLGAYRDPAKARNLVSKLKELGVPTYTEKIEAAQGPMTRVRAGPFASQEAAEKALKRVKIVGVEGPIAQR